MTHDGVTRFDGKSRITAAEILYVSGILFFIKNSIAVHSIADPVQFLDRIRIRPLETDYILIRLSKIYGSVPVLAYLFNICHYSYIFTQKYFTVLQQNKNLDCLSVLYAVGPMADIGRQL